MQEHPLLGQVALGYSAVIDRQRAVAATRLAVVPERPDAPFDGAALMQILEQAWPADGPAPGIPLGGTNGKAPLLLAPASEAVLQAVLGAPAVPRFIVEVPAFLASEPSVMLSVMALRANGGTLALKGRPREPLPADMASCFSLQIDDAGAAAPPSRLPSAMAGVAAPAEMEAAFKAGAHYAIGWPFGEPPTKPTGKAAAAPELQVILELINRVDKEEPVDRLEAVLKNDPTLAFRLLSYINSPGFGLSVEIGSFRHALMMLGYQRLKRWLALLLASASKDVSMRAVMYAAVRRGLVMEELVKGSGDAEMRGEIFICGVFSLLDRLLKQPFSELLRSVPVPQRVQQALLGEEGPFLPYLELVQAIENGLAMDIREGAARLVLGRGEVNRAVLSALSAASQLGNG